MPALETILDDACMDGGDYMDDIPDADNIANMAGMDNMAGIDNMDAMNKEK